MLGEARRISRFERILHLKRAPILRRLSAQELGVVADYARERAFDKGGMLLREGEPLRSVCVVVEGTVRVRRRGRELARAGPGAGIGGLPLFAREPSGISAAAETDVLVLELDGDALFEMLEDNFGLFRHLLADFASQILDACAALPVEVLAPLPPPPGLAWDRQHDLDLVESILFLRQASPFTWTRVSALAELSQGLSEVHYEAGTTLWRQDEPARDLLLIVSGEVGCSSVEGRAFTMGRGLVVGGLEAVAGVPRRFTARTETAVVGLRTEVENLFDIFEDNFDLGLDYLAVVARWLLAVLEQAGECGEGPARELHGCDGEDGREGRRKAGALTAGAARAAGGSL